MVNPQNENGPGAGTPRPHEEMEVPNQKVAPAAALVKPHTPEVTSHVAGLPRQVTLHEAFMVATTVHASSRATRIVLEHEAANPRKPSVTRLHALLEARLFVHLERAWEEHRKDLEHLSLRDPREIAFAFEDAIAEAEDEQARLLHALAGLAHRADGAEFTPAAGEPAAARVDALNEARRERSL